MAELAANMKVHVDMEPDERIKEMIAVEVERQLNERWNKMVNEARLGSAMKFEPMRPVTDSRGIPHAMIQGEQKT